MDPVKILDVKESILNDNDETAEQFRKELKAKGVFLLNLMGSPGAGKTSTLLRIIDALKGEFRIGVMEADVDSSVDAEKAAAAGVRVIQLHTGGSCHMDAEMTRRGVEEMGIDGLDLLVVENVGNLVCPAEFDIGANRRAEILSVPEGDDKPLKYPLMFETADVVFLNKIDTIRYFDFNMDHFAANVKSRRSGTEIIPYSAKTGEGCDRVAEWIRNAVLEDRKSI